MVRNPPNHSTNQRPVFAISQPIGAFLHNMQVMNKKTTKTTFGHNMNIIFIRKMYEE
jgi:hypothetical protein